LIFDNYTSTRPGNAVPTSTYSKKTPVNDEFAEDSSSRGSTQELAELRRQLQSIKKQSLMVMEQSRKSSEREKIALQQAQDAIAEKETAVDKAAEASRLEKFMVELMLDASLDMTGMLH
jgi:hypothetical protein